MRAALMAAQMLISTGPRWMGWVMSWYVGTSLLGPITTSFFPTLGAYHGSAGMALTLTNPSFAPSGIVVKMPPRHGSSPYSAQTAHH